MVASGELVLMYATKKVMAPSHFLYIDDILIFCRGLKKNIHQVVNLFRWYGDISGQRVNWNKSQVFCCSIPISWQIVLFKLRG